MDNMDRLKLSQKDWAEFIEWQRKLFRKPGSPRELELSSEDFDWAEAWDAADRDIAPPTDNSRRMLRIGHYKGWMDCRC